MWQEKNKQVKLEQYFSSLENKSPSSTTVDDSTEGSSSNVAVTYQNMLNKKETIEIYGGGQFRKSGKFFESWKHRSYFIYSNSVLIYFENNLPKNVINLTEIRIEEGDDKMIKSSGFLKNKSKNKSQNSATSEEGEDEDTPIPMILHLPNDCREKVKIVFENVDEAQKFCLLLFYGSQVHNIVDYVYQKQWSRLISAIDDIKTNEQEKQRGFFPVMNSLTKEDLHQELSLLQSAIQIVLVKLSLLNGALRKSGITIENPMDLLNETYDMARCHLLRHHYQKKEQYLQERISQCNHKLSQSNLPSGVDLEQQPAEDFDVGDVGVEVGVDEKIVKPPQPPPPPPRKISAPPEMQVTSQSERIPPPPPKPPNISLSSSVLMTKHSSSSLTSSSPPFSPKPPTPVVSPARPTSVDRNEKIRALWPSNDDDEDDPMMKRQEPSSSSRPLSLPHNLRSAASPAVAPPLPPPTVPSPSPSRTSPSSNMNLQQAERRSSFALKQQKLSHWRREIHSRLESSYSTMKKIVPRDIPLFLSPNDHLDTQIQQFCYHFGFEPTLAKRILQKKCLWLISFTDSEIARITHEDLEDGGAYALKGQALDIVELSAVYFRLDPLPFDESDQLHNTHNHSQQPLVFPSQELEDVVHKVRKKLKYYLTQEENGTLPSHLQRHPAYSLKEEVKEERSETIPSNSSQKRRGSLRYEEI